ncbi:MAG: antitoxin VapB family protein [Nanoarchaeota archaeon]
MVKLISLSNDVYEKLKSMKRNNESFSQLLRRTTMKEKNSLLDFAGAINDTSFDKAMEIVLSKRKNRSKMVLRFD